MNLKNKILITIMFALGTILWSCDSLIYDNLEDCPQGVYVKFYSMTPCDNDSSFIGEVPSITVFAFDSNDKLVVSTTENNVNLSRDYEILMPVSNGSFSFVGWAGVNDNFELSSLKPGTTTKKDVLLTLKNSNNIAANLTGTQVWQGESSVVTLPSVDDVGSVYKYTAVNLTEVTNRVNVTVTFTELIQELYDTSKLFVEVSSESGTYNVDGSMPLDQKALQFPITHITDLEDNGITSSFEMMDLQPKQGNLLKVYYKDINEEGEEEEKIVFLNDLVGAILMAAKDNPGEINLYCENEFDIRLDIIGACEDCPDTYFSCDVYVNDWKVHSYSTDL